MKKLWASLVLSAGVVGLLVGQVHLPATASPGATAGTTQDDKDTGTTGGGLIARVKKLEDDLKALKESLAAEKQEHEERLKVAAEKRRVRDSAIDRRLDGLATDLASSRITIAVRDYFLMSDAGKHLQPTGYGPWLNRPQVFLPLNARTEQVIPERFGREVLAAALIPVTIDPDELHAYEVIKADASGNQIKIWGERKGAPWGLWVRVYVFYRE